MTQKSHPAWQDLHGALTTLEEAIHHLQPPRNNDDARKAQLLKQLDETIAALEKITEQFHGHSEGHGQ